ncbi:MAG: hypothetical protein CMK07_07345 [Ponticaulis sp.]|nr:hypothetical protein [Ponticaulis sp.]
MRHLIFVFAGVFLAACATPSGPTKQGAEEFLWAYTEAWNEHDTDKLGSEFWQTTDSVETETERLEAMFAQITADGYDRSTIHSILVCLGGEDMAVADMRFTRYLTSGEVMGPDMRASKYLLDWEEARGWRIRGVFGGDVNAPVACDLTLFPPMSE